MERVAVVAACPCVALARRATGTSGLLILMDGEHAEVIQLALTAAW